MSKCLADEIGITTLDHAAFHVRTGMFIGAKAFFLEQLRWIEDGTVGGEGWRAVFLKPTTTSAVRVQLTESNAFPVTPQIFPGAHLGILVKDAMTAAHKIELWAQRAGIQCEIEPANTQRTKWFVRLPDLFTFALEFITAA